MKNEEKRVESMDTIPISSRPSDPGLSIVLDKCIYDALWRFVIILPKCDICNKFSTREFISSEGIVSYICDEHHSYDDAATDVSWSEAVRNLNASLKFSGYSTDSNDIMDYFVDQLRK